MIWVPRDSAQHHQLAISPPCVWQQIQIKSMTVVSPYVNFTSDIFLSKNMCVSYIFLQNFHVRFLSGPAQPPLPSSYLSHHWRGRSAKFVRNPTSLFVQIQSCPPPRVKRTRYPLRLGCTNCTVSPRFRPRLALRALLPCSLEFQHSLMWLRSGCDSQFFVWWFHPARFFLAHSDIDFPRSCVWAKFVCIPIGPFSLIFSPRLQFLFASIILIVAKEVVSGAFFMPNNNTVCFPLRSGRISWPIFRNRLWYLFIFSNFEGLGFGTHADNILTIQHTTRYHRI